MIQLLLIILIIFVHIRSNVGVEWCSKNLECDLGFGPIKNTMCTYKPQTQTTECSGIADVQTPDSRASMLKFHNEYRNKLAGGGMEGWPKAANMREMSWDHEVESVALRWAVQCRNGHDECRRTSQFASVGQNYAGRMASDKYGTDTNQINFDGWVEEISMISDPKTMVTSFRGGAWGHFTQIIWAESFKLGCASVHFEKDDWKTSVDLCNYAPGGNVMTLPMYEEGEPASKCPTGTSPSKQYHNLCAGEGEGSGGGPDDGVKPADGDGPGDGDKSAGGAGPGEGTVDRDKSTSAGGPEGDPGYGSVPGEGGGIGLIANDGLVHVININPKSRDLQGSLNDTEISKSEDILSIKSEINTVNNEDQTHDSYVVQDHQCPQPSLHASCKEARPVGASQDHHKHEPCETSSTLKTTHKPIKHRKKEKSAATLSRLHFPLKILIILFTGL